MRAGSVRLLVLDVALLAALVIGASLWLARLGGLPRRVRSASTRAVRAIAIVVAAGLPRAAARWSASCASRGASARRSPRPRCRRADGKLDLAAAPRRALVVTLQLAIVLLAGLPCSR